MKTKTSLMALAGLVLGLIQGLFWRFNLFLHVDNFYPDFIFSWLVPLIIGTIVLITDENDTKRKVINSLLFWLLAVMIYFIIIIPKYIF